MAGGHPQKERCRGGGLEGGRLKMTDNTRMTEGVHKGVRMKAVPASYLLHLPKNVVTEALKKYVADNQKVLRLEARRDGQLVYKKWMEKR